MGNCHNPYNRVVIKIGTSTLAHSTGLLNIRRVESIIKVLSDLKNAGKEIVLVSSGAVGVGAGKLSLKSKPTNLHVKQACASIGQCELMYTYDKLFSEYNHIVSQVLLTKSDVENAMRKTNIINTFESLLKMGVLPVVNENDTVSTDEIEFGDNDTLSAIVSVLVKADLLIIMTDIDGLYDKSPVDNEDAQLITVVNDINDEIRASAGGAGSKFGSGGMVTKIDAAEIAQKAGIPTIVVNGNRSKLLYDIFDNKPVGTLFQA